MVIIVFSIFKVFYSTIIFLTIQRFHLKVVQTFLKVQATAINNCESLRLKFDSIFYKAHPNIYRFIEALKNEKQDTRIHLSSII